ncbi:fimbrial protein [Providencia rettgeri]|uniref:fimbrial protein n=1 Tax=Providencia rettgeri TaxID=587 RepID=UPI0032DBCECE
MNKYLFYLVVLIIILPKLAFSDRAIININANVIERSCTIDNESQNLIVDLQGGDLRQSNIGVGMPFAGTAFSIKLVDCPANISVAHIKFSGESDVTMGNLLKNTDSTVQAAQGVALGLYSGNNNIDIRNNQTTLTLDHSLESNIFKFFVYYVKTGGVANPGKVISIADFEVAYD